MDEAAIRGARREYEALLMKQSAYTDALRVLVQQLCNSEPDLEIDSVHARTKTVRSVAEKLRRRPQYESIHDVIDRSGVRVIAADQSIVEPTCHLLTREFEVLEVVQHGAESPEAFGYASRHLVVRIKEPRSQLPEWQQFDGMVAEIQVRSILQHAWALISHQLDYKSTTEVPDRVNRRLFRVAAMLEETDEIFVTFRRDVASLRAEYREGVERDDWRKLDLDVDSAVAAWSHFPWKDIDEAAVRAGFPPATAWTYAEPLDDTDREVLSRLVRCATATGMRRLGDLADYALAATDREPELRKINEGLEQQYPSVALDVLTALLLYDNADDARAINDSYGDDAYPDDIIEAVVTAARS